MLQLSTWSARSRSAREPSDYYQTGPPGGNVWRPHDPLGFAGEQTFSTPSRFPQPPSARRTARWVTKAAASALSPGLRPGSAGSYRDPGVSVLAVDATVGLIAHEPRLELQSAASSANGRTICAPTTEPPDTAIGPEPLGRLPSSGFQAREVAHRRRGCGSSRARRRGRGLEVARVGSSDTGTRMAQFERRQRDDVTKDSALAVRRRFRVGPGFGQTGWCGLSGRLSATSLA